MRIGLREAFLLAVLLALPLSSWWLVFRPQNADIAQARREIQHKQSMLAKVQQTTARTQDLQRENEEIRTQIESIEARLPSIPALQWRRAIIVSGAIRDTAWHREAVHLANHSLATWMPPASRATSPSPPPCTWNSR